MVTFDPQTIKSSTLKEWHELGVRGVRVNFASVGKEVSDASEFAKQLQAYADIIRPFNWVLQLYVPLITCIALETIIPTLRVRVCLDHFGQPKLPSSSGKEGSFDEDPDSIPGFRSLVNLLEQGDTYLKLSAPYRISGEDRCLEAMAIRLLNLAGKSRVVFATDWPHTRFEGLDIKPFVERVVGWCGDDDSMIERVFKSNAEDLWGVEV